MKSHLNLWLALQVLISLWNEQN